MKHCGGCRRHLRVAEARCPFCGAIQRELLGASAGRWALAATLASVGCADRSIADDAGEASAEGTGTPDSTTSATSTTSTVTTDGPTSTPLPTTSGPPPPTSSGSTDADSSTTDITGQSFVLYGGGDGGSVTVECSIFDQDCPDGEKCMPWANDGGNAWNATRCAPVDPDGAAVGEACSFEGSQVSGVDDCVIGAICLGNGLAGEGRCVELCGVDCDTPGSACVEEGQLYACLVPCDPFAAVGCANGDVCVGIGAGSYCMPPLGTGAGYGESCAGPHDCANGLICSETALPDCVSGVCCTALCDLNAPDPDALCPDAAAGVGCSDPGYAPPFDGLGICHQ